ncbi:peptidoglycan D,D-transpeptidase FtsI family protein [Pseudonocardia oroxyli]|uniref:Cell division protein FtsI (Penicillin-binding protein 3) n=2 Tax=Pseudonocardia TaxID=1847 RepID=A0A1G7EKE3_PSEOR|nr:penicillin-binding protein 2 [Pseudonocardia oroxyli]SDE64098.1 cell division protein FtsI (penicillin-binding protein 3) [Pseudonocardia oroxyli]
MPLRRFRIGRLVLILLLLASAMQLVLIQTVRAGDLTASAEKQRTTRITIAAERGAITDRNGNRLAFSTEARALVTNPRLISSIKKDQAPAYKADMAQAVAEATGGDPNALRGLLDADRGYVVLTTSADPDVARALRERFPEIAEEKREARQYPAGNLAANVIGAASWSADNQKLVGRVGLESSDDGVLAGTDGFQIVDTAEGSDTVIPGSTRAQEAAVPGSDVELTLDSDLQYVVQQKLQDYVAKTGARGGSAVVLDAKTGEVRAMANGTTFDPRSLGTADPATLGNAAVSSPFEPGSVNKIVTMAGALEYGIAKPDDVLDVPGSIKVADRTVHDAWNHGLDHYTLTGVLAKSSNVGTIMTAEQLGADRFSDMLARFGIGQRTNVGLPGESAGSVPARESWSGSTFGNLPIGQGLSMTVLQMAGMYQAVANDGVRIPPRIVAATIGPDGSRTEEPRPDPVQVVSPQTAQQLRTMLTAVTQKAPGGNSGTGYAAQVPGYQVAGKTGTAQQVDPSCGCYASSTYWITFAGMLPAQNPNFVVAIMLDAPGGGTSAAPLFHDIASYLAQQERVPVGEPAPVQTLVVP